MSQEISCPFCGHNNPADAMFCEACSRVLEDPETLEDQNRKTYLSQENIQITETSAYLFGKTFPISEIKEVEIIEAKKDRRIWGVGLIIFGLGTVIDGLFDGDLIFPLFCGLPGILAGALLAVLTRPKEEEMVPNLWITTRDGTEDSLVLKDEAEAVLIKEAILKSCAENEGLARK